MDVFLTIPNSNKTKLITLLGRGIQNIPRQNSLFTKPLTNYQKSSKLSMKLSESLINFGKIPLFARKTKTMFLQNTSAQDVILFTFKLPNENLFQITPNHGRLAPNEYGTVTIIYNALPPEKVFYDEIICEVMLEEESIEFNKNMVLFKDMKKRAECEFTIDESNLQEQNGPQSPKNFQKSYTSLKGSPTRYQKLSPIQPKHEPTFNRNETIPSINSRASRYRKPAQKDDFKIEFPQPPEVLLLHVTLTGESEKSSNLPSGMTYFNIKKSNLELAQEARKNVENDGNIYEGEPEIMEDLCGDLIHEILYGSDILNKIEVLDTVEPPRYQQLTDKQLGNFRERENTEPNLFKTILRSEGPRACYLAISGIFPGGFALKWTETGISGGKNRAPFSPQVKQTTKKW